MAIASLTICRPLSPATSSISHFNTRRLPSMLSIPQHLSFSDSPAVQFPGDSSFRRSTRAITVVTRAGPSTNTLIFAFVFPFTLLVVTVFAAMRIGDRLDKKFLEELAMNQAIKEMDDEDEEDDDTIIVTTREEEPALPRTRNRPKREV